MIEFKTFDLQNFPVAIYRSSSYTQQIVQTYTSTQSLKGAYLVSDSIEEIKEYLKNISISVQGTISPKDKLFFHHTTIFPSLLLGRLDIQLSRTTKLTNADKIIVSSEFGKVKYDFHKASMMTIQEKLYRLDWGVSDDFKRSQEDWAKANLPGTLKIFYSLDPETVEIIKMSNANKNKLVCEDVLIKYALPKLSQFRDDDEFNNMILSLNSKNEATCLVAINALPYYDIRDRIPEIYFSLINSPNNIPMNVNTKYLFKILGLTNNLLKVIRSSYQKEKLKYKMDIVNNPYITSTIKDKVLYLLRKDLSEAIKSNYSTELKALSVNVELIVNDEIGETTSSN